MKKIIVSLVFIFSVCLFAGAEEAALPVIGNLAPSFELNTIDGVPFCLQSQLSRSKKTLLVFFTSWSKSSQNKLNDLQKLCDSNEKKSKFDIVAVSFDKKTKDLKSFAARSGFSFPILHDKSLALVDLYQILIIPTTFCINQEGRIEQILVDYDKDTLKSLDILL